jgi:phosphoribosyl-ATP pyrophosphohydrolase
MDQEPSVFEHLMSTIEDRRKNPPLRSYTTTLFQGGVDRIGCKIMEEAAEVVRAGRQSGDSADARANLVHEAGDVIYHLFVLLGFCEISLAEVEAELAKRFGTSGLDEKAARK